MRIQHNIPALNAHRNLTNNNSSVSKNLEKLSSGYRINRAGDDAAGLAISEKMRAQITGLQTAQKNAEDGVSLVQTAEGALTEVHSMLNRMVELATQSANGTYSVSNREEMQKEIDALTEEVNRISDTSNFNGTKLFGGTGNTLTATGKVNGVSLKGTEQEGTQATYEGEWKGGAAAGTDASFTITVEDGEGNAQTVNIANFNVTANMSGADVASALNAEGQLAKLGITVSDDGAGNLTFTSAEVGTDAKHVTNVTFADSKNPAASGSSFTATTGETVGTDAGEAYNFTAFVEGDSITVNGKTYTFDANGDGTNGKFNDFAALTKALEADGIEVVDQKGDGSSVLLKAKDGTALKTNIALHVGESSDDANTIDVTIDAMSAKSLGIDTVDITTVDGAKKAINTINAAIDTVSSIRSSLGAMQNRLEHTINNLGVQTENITAAESRIRDVDMAKEMMAYTKNNILVQASQAMLAQANQVPQGVLQLLQ